MSVGRRKRHGAGAPAKDRHATARAHKPERKTKEWSQGFRLADERAAEHVMMTGHTWHGSRLNGEGLTKDKGYGRQLIKADKERRDQEEENRKWQ